MADVKTDCGVLDCGGMVEPGELGDAGVVVAGEFGTVGVATTLVP